MIEELQELRLKLILLVQEKEKQQKLINFKETEYYQIKQKLLKLNNSNLFDNKYFNMIVNSIKGKILPFILGVMITLLVLAPYLPNFVILIIFMAFIITYSVSFINSMRNENEREKRKLERKLLNIEKEIIVLNREYKKTNIFINMIRKEINTSDVYNNLSIPKNLKEEISNIEYDLDNPKVLYFHK